jgi:hypothetical protein
MYVSALISSADLSDLFTARYIKVKWDLFLFCHSAFQQNKKYFIHKSFITEWGEGGEMRIWIISDTYEWSTHSYFPSSSTFPTYSFIDDKRFALRRIRRSFFHTRLQFVYLLTTTTIMMKMMMMRRMMKFFYFNVFHSQMRFVINLFLWRLNAGVFWDTLIDFYWLLIIMLISIIQLLARLRNI